VSEDECSWMQGIQVIGGHHKNISYKPHKDKLSGLPKTAGVTRSRLHTILRRYSAEAVACAGNLLPRYRDAWKVDYASFRPMEEAGRELPWKKRNDLLHTDAFPTRPTGGGMILRIFWNLHPAKPRVWLISEPFEKLASRYAMAAGLGRIAQKRAWFRNLSRRFRLPVRSRSAYDEFMLKFHDFLKRNTEFQSQCPKHRLEFQPGAAWMVFTDVVPHAVSSGQFAMEQTLIVPPESLAAPERAPISILQNLAGRSLA
jgi:3-deoxy-D-manno-oct-2-ulosonic acid (Kdo) hydroxylase